MGKSEAEESKPKRRQFEKALAQRRAHFEDGGGAMMSQETHVVSRSWKR